MERPKLRFNRSELAGGLGDLGILLPLALALITINGLSFSTVFLMTGLVYVATGLFYGIPVPVQPLKLVAALAIASPTSIGPPQFAAAALLFGAILLVLALTGAVDVLAKLFTKPIVRGIQMGTGLILLGKGVHLISRDSLFVVGAGGDVSHFGVPVNVVLGIAAGVVILLLLGTRRVPATLVVVGAGVLAGAAYGAFRGLDPRLGPTAIEIAKPAWSDFETALLLLVLPQLPLTFGNAIIGSTDAAKRLLGDGPVTCRVTNRNYAIGMGISNLAIGTMGGMPV
jgi:SulP family sulfate permease